MTQDILCNMIGKVADRISDNQAIAICVVGGIIAFLLALGL